MDQVSADVWYEKLEGATEAVRLLNGGKHWTIQEERLIFLLCELNYCTYSHLWTEFFPENIEGRAMSVTYVGFEKRKSRVVEEVSKSPPLLATEEPEKSLNIDANNNQQV